MSLMARRPQGRFPCAHVYRQDTPLGFDASPSRLLTDRLVRWLSPPLDLTDFAVFARLQLEPRTDPARCRGQSPEAKYCSSTDTKQVFFPSYFCSQGGYRVPVPGTWYMVHGSGSDLPYPVPVRYGDGKMRLLGFGLWGYMYG